MKLAFSAHVNCQPYIFTINHLQQLLRICCCISSLISPCRVSGHLHCAYFCCTFATSYPLNSSMLTVKFVRARANWRSWKPPGCFVTCCSGAWKVNQHFPNKLFEYFNLFVFVFGCSPATMCNSFPVPLLRLWRQHHINTQQYPHHLQFLSKMNDLLGSGYVNTGGHGFDRVGDKQKQPDSLHSI